MSTFGSRYANRLAEQSFSVETSLGMNFLNDSNSRWERALEPWAVQVYGSDTVDPIFKDSSTRSIKVSSSDPLNAVFHPALLLALGDLLAFSKALSPPAPSPPASPALVAAESEGQRPPQPPQQQRVLSRIGSLARLEGKDSAAWGGAAGDARRQQQLPLPPIPRGGTSHKLLNPQGSFELPAPAAAPALEDQMALSMPVTSRVPRRYMIHNLTGSTIFYSPSDIEHTQRLYQVDSLVS